MRFILAPLLLVLAFSAHAEEDAKAKLEPVKHIIVIYLENHSFDNLFGTFPGADGISNAGDRAIQTGMDDSGHDRPFTDLPRVMNEKNPDTRFPEQLPNKPFLITKYVPADAKTGDLVHRFYQLQQQVNGGRMDKFVWFGNAGALTMGYYEEKNSPLWQYAKQYTLADHFFVGAFGGSMLNHFWLICACTPRYKNAPEETLAVLDDKGSLVRDGALTPDGYAVNTIEPFSPPYKKKATDPARRLPLQTLPTIGERLSEKNIPWAWYGGGWKDAAAGNPDPSFQPHHYPFNYFALYAEGTKARAEHLKDESDFVDDIEKGTLPPVSFYKPLGKVDMHPGYAQITESEAHIFDLVHKIEKSPAWKDSFIIITFDDAGGFWDHVPPPKGDRFGPGERIPTVIISPFAKRGFVDHTTYDTTSILKLIETKFGLKPLGDRDAKANDLTNALE